MSESLQASSNSKAFTRPSNEAFARYQQLWKYMKMSESLQASWKSEAFKRYRQLWKWVNRSRHPETVRPSQDINNYEHEWIAPKHPQKVRPSQDIQQLWRWVYRSRHPKKVRLSQTIQDSENKGTNRYMRHLEETFRDASATFPSTIEDDSLRILTNP